MRTLFTDLKVGEKVSLSDLKVGDRVACWHDGVGAYGMGGWIACTIKRVGEIMTTGGPRPEVVADIDPDRRHNVTYHPSPSGFTRVEPTTCFVYEGVRRLA